MERGRTITELVISRREEHGVWDSRWLDEVASSFDLITVYNKGPVRPSTPPGWSQFESVSLPDVGGAAHSYLTHIVENYDILADRTVFCADDQRPNAEDLWRISHGEALVHHRTVDVPWDETLVQHWRGPDPPVPCGRTVRQFFERWGIARETCPWREGGCVTATRAEIHRRSLDTYQALLETTGLSRHTHPEEAYLMERAWYPLWRKPMVECILTRAEPAFQ